MPTQNITPILREDILNGAISAGAPLRQDSLAERFGVSKIPVREALRLLEADGLVEFRPNCGARVAIFSPADFAEMFDIRVALECRALELAIPNFVEPDIHSAQEILVEYAKTTDHKMWSDLNLRFHQILYRPCGRPRLLKMIDKLQGQIGLSRRLRVTLITGFERPHREHQALLDACINSDVTQAVRLLRLHIDVSQKEVAAFFRNSPEWP